MATKCDDGSFDDNEQELEMMMEGPEYEVELVGRPRPTGGIYSLPHVGGVAAEARMFFDDMAPKATDPVPVRALKETARWSVVVAGGAMGAAVTATVVL